jgi:hypothetical protein
MEKAAGRLYSYASSFVHAYKWMSDPRRHSRSQDCCRRFVTALIMPECTVALFEAQSTHPARTALRRKKYPQSLVPTVKAWALRYQ